MFAVRRSSRHRLAYFPSKPPKKTLRKNEITQILRYVLPSNNSLRVYSRFLKKKNVFLCTHEQSIHSSAFHFQVPHTAASLHKDKSFAWRTLYLPKSSQRNTPQRESTRRVEVSLQKRAFVHTIQLKYRNAHVNKI